MKTKNKMMNVCYNFITKTKPFEFEIQRPEGFVVKEILDRNSIKKYDLYGSRKYKYSIFLMKKVNTNTIDAVKNIANLLKISGSDIGFAGLKDKNAVTYQYISLKNELKDKINKLKDKLSEKKIELSYVSQGKKLKPGDLIGNKFEIFMKPNPSNKFIKDFIESLTTASNLKIMPNYFGVQRFGSNRNNHIIGYHILRREFEEANELMKKSNIKSSKKIMKFFINAYQSWIFNEIVNHIIKDKKNITKIKRNKIRMSSAPLPGFNSKPRKNFKWEIINKIHKDHGISLKDYRINELKLTARGSERPLFINVKNITFNNELSFTLPKGSYATVLLNEISKVRCP